MKKFFKKIRQMFCIHKYTIEVFTKEKRIYTKKLDKGKAITRYDVYAREVCVRCGHIKPLSTEKIRSNLTWEQARVHINKYN